MNHMIDKNNNLHEVASGEALPLRKLSNLNHSVLYFTKENIKLKPQSPFISRTPHQET